MTNKQGRSARFFDKQQKAALRALGRNNMAMDQFSNVATIEATESATGTLTYAQLNTGVGFGTKRGMLIEAVQFFMGTSVQNLILDESDYILVALTVSAGPTDLGNFGDRRILSNLLLGQRNSGTPANAEQLVAPITQRYTPGLPLAEPTIYLGVQGTSLASVITCRVRIFFRYIDLTPSDILEIAQNFQLVG